MDKVILIRIGEIFLKGGNRRFFEKKLADNLNAALRSYAHDVSRSQNRFVVENYDPELENEIVSKIRKVFGVCSVSPALKVESDFALVRKAAVSLVREDGPVKFRVTVRRADKRIPMNSAGIAAEIGGDVLDAHPSMIVDLERFDLELCVDIRENGYTYIFTEKLRAAGGMPVGSAGRALCLLSGGIDSPVAIHRMAKRGMEISAVHFHSAPYTSERAKEKVMDLAGILSLWTGAIDMYVVPFTEIQEEIHRNCPPEYMVTIMRRFMMRISERLAAEHSCDAIVTGESLGQVASQTVQGIASTDSVLHGIPVFRPLIGMDKEEIVAIAKEIGTFDLSILPYQDCCTLFLPKNPVIKPKLRFVERAEAALDADGLVERAIGGVQRTAINRQAEQP